MAIATSSHTLIRIHGSLSSAQSVTMDNPKLLLTPKVHLGILPRRVKVKERKETSQASPIKERMAKAPKVRVEARVRVTAKARAKAKESPRVKAKARKADRITRTIIQDDARMPREAFW